MLQIKLNLKGGTKIITTSVSTNMSSSMFWHYIVKGWTTHSVDNIFIGQCNILDNTLDTTVLDSSHKSSERAHLNLTLSS